jgi:hypothetical protein
MGRAMSALTTKQMIDHLTLGILGPGASLREKFILAESLNGLVRLAKIEQRMEIKRSVEKASVLAAATAARRQTKGLVRRISSEIVQPGLKFG